MRFVEQLTSNGSCLELFLGHPEAEHSLPMPFPADLNVSRLAGRGLNHFNFFIRGNVQRNARLVPGSGRYLSGRFVATLQ